MQPDSWIGRARDVRPDRHAGTGKLAEVILVAGIPLEDRSVLRNVEVVVKGGEGGGSHPVR